MKKLECGEGGVIDNASRGSRQLNHMAPLRLPCGVWMKWLASLALASLEVTAV